MNKLKAFTILELTAVMLLSTMVLGIAYSGYLLFYRQYIGFKAGSEKQASFSLADRLLENDFYDASKIVKTERGIQCIFSNKIVEYEWLENSMVRKGAGIIDTFNFSRLDSVQYRFSSGNVIPGGLVNEVGFTDRNEEEEKNFYYHKVYGADLLLNEYKPHKQWPE